MAFEAGEKTNVTPAAAHQPSAHPLALELAATLRRATREVPRVLLLGFGSGRNVAPLLDAGASVDVVEADTRRAAGALRQFAGDGRVRIVRVPYRGPFPFASGHSAALSTHALLHGTPATIGAALAATRDRLAAGASLYATLGSTRDPRFGAGVRIDEATFASPTGSEAGVPHAYFDGRTVLELLRDFIIDDLTEASAAESAGRWAHGESEAAGMMHWFARVRKR